MSWKELRKKKWFGVVGNLYVLVLTIFTVWMLFFDTNSLLIHMELRREIRKLREQQEFLKGEIARDREVIERLSDPKELEKFAREAYYLKRKEEEVFLIEYEDSVKQSKDGKK